MANLRLTDEELATLEKVVDKDTPLYEKIQRKYKHHRHRHIPKNVRLLRKIGRMARKDRERELSEGLISDDGSVSIPKWLFETLPEPINTNPCTNLEALTIDTINMLSGWERQQALKGYHEWKARQKETDKLMQRRVEQRVRRRQLRHRDPEGYAIQQKIYKERYKEATRKYMERKKKDKNWLAQRREYQRKRYIKVQLDAKLLEERRAKQRERYHLEKEKYKNDPEWKAKKNAQHLKSYHKNRKKILAYRKKEYARKKEEKALLDLMIGENHEV
jgi:hypothetical protein